MGSIEKYEFNIEQPSFIIGQESHTKHMWKQFTLGLLQKQLQSIKMISTHTALLTIDGTPYIVICETIQTDSKLFVKVAYWNKIKPHQFPSRYLVVQNQFMNGDFYPNDAGYIASSYQKGYDSMIRAGIISNYIENRKILTDRAAIQPSNNENRPPTSQ